jgi:hypothetical protein
MLAFFAPKIQMSNGCVPDPSKFMIRFLGPIQLNEFTNRLNALCTGGSGINGR